MLDGEAVVAIWNGIAPEMRAEFHAWHICEHIPERVAIPGFRRGRRLIAAVSTTHPEFFTLYEADSMNVLRGSAYRARLDAPTPWTRQVTRHFQDTSRALARVVLSSGVGVGGAMLTLRFAAGASAEAALAALVRKSATLPRICAAHLCVGDAEASGVGSAETTGRTDLQTPPAWFALVEATDTDALAAVLPDAELLGGGASGPIARGVYLLEFLYR
jgi:hypothetical protein